MLSRSRSQFVAGIAGLMCLLLLCLTAVLTSAGGQEQRREPARDPLPSWSDGKARQAILEFVRGVTERSSPQYVPPEQRIATFDLDGTLWVEQPIYTQVQFAFDRIKALAPAHPEWKTEEPFKSLLTGDAEVMLKFSIQDFEKAMAVSHSGMTVEEYHEIVKHWLATTRHPRYKRPYTELIYQPMLEVMRYFRAHGFKTYIVTGSGQEFVRVFAEQVLGVPPEQVVGTAIKTRYEYDKNGRPVLLRLPAALYIDNNGGKPEGINLIIGRRPYAAFGNSTGDQQMLEWTQAGGGLRLMMLVHHDDAEREYAYGANSRIGTFSDALMTEARQRGWIVISMKNDWKRIFPFSR